LPAIFEILGILGVMRPWPFRATWRHWSHQSFDSPRAISYWRFVDTKSLSLTVSEIFCLIQLPTLIANISGMDRQNENLKTALSTTSPPLFGKENLVNFGPLKKNRC